MARFQEGTANLRFEGIATPTEDTDAANKAYVDALMPDGNGIPIWEADVVYATGDYVIRYFDADLDDTTNVPFSAVYLKLTPGGTSDPKTSPGNWEYSTSTPILTNTGEALVNSTQVPSVAKSNADIAAAIAAIPAVDTDITGKADVDLGNIDAAGIAVIDGRIPAPIDITGKVDDTQITLNEDEVLTQTTEIPSLEYVDARNHADEGVTTPIESRHDTGRTLFRLFGGTQPALVLDRILGVTNGTVLRINSKNVTVLTSSTFFLDGSVRTLITYSGAVLGDPDLNNAVFIEAVSQVPVHSVVSSGNINLHLDGSEVTIDDHENELTYNDLILSDDTPFNGQYSFRTGALGADDEIVDADLLTSIKSLFLARNGREGSDNVIAIERLTIGTVVIYTQAFSGVVFNFRVTEFPRLEGTDSRRIGVDVISESIMLNGVSDATLTFADLQQGNTNGVFEYSPDFGDQYALSTHRHVAFEEFIPNPLDLAVTIERFRTSTIEFPIVAATTADFARSLTSNEIVISNVGVVITDHYEVGTYVVIKPVDVPMNVVGIITAKVANQLTLDIFSQFTDSTNGAIDLLTGDLLADQTLVDFAAFDAAVLYMFAPLESITGAVQFIAAPTSIQARVEAQTLEFLTVDAAEHVDIIAKDLILDDGTGGDPGIIFRDPDGDPDPFIHYDTSENEIAIRHSGAGAGSRIATATDLALKADTDLQNIDLDLAEFEKVAIIERIGAAINHTEAGEALFNGQVLGGDFEHDAIDNATSINLTFADSDEYVAARNFIVALETGIGPDRDPANAVIIDTVGFNSMLRLLVLGFSGPITLPASTDSGTAFFLFNLIQERITNVVGGTYLNGTLTIEDAGTSTVVQELPPIGTTPGETWVDLDTGQEYTFFGGAWAQTGGYRQDSGIIGVVGLGVTEQQLTDINTIPTLTTEVGTKANSNLDNLGEVEARANLAFAVPTEGFVPVSWDDIHGAAQTLGSLTDVNDGDVFAVGLAFAELTLAFNISSFETQAITSRAMRLEILVDGTDQPTADLFLNGALQDGSHVLIRFNDTDQTRVDFIVSQVEDFRLRAVPTFHLTLLATSTTAIPAEYVLGLFPTPFASDVRPLTRTTTADEVLIRNSVDGTWNASLVSALNTSTPFRTVNPTYNYLLDADVRTVFPATIDTSALQILVLQAFNDIADIDRYTTGGQLRISAGVVQSTARIRRAPVLRAGQTNVYDVTVLWDSDTVDGIVIPVFVTPEFGTASTPAVFEDITSVEGVNPGTSFVDGILSLPDQRNTTRAETFTVTPSTILITLVRTQTIDGFLDSRTTFVTTATAITAFTDLDLDVGSVIRIHTADGTEWRRIDALGFGSLNTTNIVFSVEGNVETTDSTFYTDTASGTRELGRSVRTLADADVISEDTQFEGFHTDGPVVRMFEHDWQLRTARAGSYMVFSAFGEDVMSIDANGNIRTQGTITTVTNITPELEP